MQITITIPTAATFLGQWRWLLALLLVLAFTLGSGDHAAATNNSFATPDSTGDVGAYSSLALDSAGNPVVSYFDGTNGDLKILHCNDANCTGGGESITSPDTAGTTGQFSSLELDASGNPVVSYCSVQVFFMIPFCSNLKVMHCNDANCAGGDESITTPELGGGFGDLAIYISLELDASGFPVVSYFDGGPGDLRLMHCNDANCADGDETFTSPDTANTVGEYTSLALDSSGNPVISYYYSSGSDLRLMHCNDADCTGGDESVTSPDTTGIVGSFTSLALDTSGFPVVSYHDNTNFDLKVMHCNDANCAGADESIASPHTAGSAGQPNSLVLDAVGYPVISYGADGVLTVMHCNDANCVGGDESIAGPDAGGITTNPLTLDGSGNPVVSYYDVTNDDLRLLHCSNPACAGKAQMEIVSMGQYDLPKTCFDVLDSAMTQLFSVCDNDFQGTPASDPLCVPDGVCDDEDAAAGIVALTVLEGGYLVETGKAAPEHTPDLAQLACTTSTSSPCSVTFVSTPGTRPWHPWDITGEGLVRVDDILAVVNHYFQDKP